MKTVRTDLALLVPAFLCCLAFVGMRPWAVSAAPWRLSGESFVVEFDESNGSILRVASSAGGSPSIFRSDKPGLWSVKLRDGPELHAAEFSTANSARKFHCEESTADTLRFQYTCDQVDVTITVGRRPDGVAFSGSVHGKQGTVLEFALPGRLTFTDTRLTRFICPANGNQSVGTAFLPAFFRQQSAESATQWQPESVGPRGFHALFGGYLKTAAELDRPVALKVTRAGRAWLGVPLSNQFEATPTTVNRGGDPEHADLVLIDSPNGPYFYAKRVADGGFLWRIGGRVERDENQRRNALWMVGIALEQLARRRQQEQRDTIGLLDLPYGPATGSWTDLSAKEWHTALSRLPAVHGNKTKLVALDSLASIDRALASDAFLAIVNPYGEFLPMAADRNYDDQIEAIRQFVRAGGNWFETGGYPFYAALRPVAHYLHYESGYPPAFADFFHWQTSGGTASLYRVSPRTWKPWTATTDRSAIFTPGRVACGGADSGRWCERPFVTYVGPGQTWTSPTVRLRLGNSVQRDLAAYARENQIDRTLDEKLPEALREKFRHAVLVKYEGSCQELLDHLDRLPTPSLIHISRYLHGGFDKQYPDHLPPGADFGTSEQLRHFCATAHAKGHLVMPYTNPTWWCDEPRGPTFRAHGAAPLLRKLDGSVSAERYVHNTGFTVCHWHAAVQEANRKTRRQARHRSVQITRSSSHGGQCGQDARRFVPLAFHRNQQHATQAMRLDRTRAFVVHSMNQVSNMYDGRPRPSRKRRSAP